MGRKGLGALIWKKNPRSIALGVVIAVGAVLLPASFAAGSHGETLVDGSEPSVVLLTLGSQDHVKWEGLTQGITTRRNDCLAVSFAESPQLLVVSAIGGQLGEVRDGLGVAGPQDGSGEPCGRVSPGQAISVALGSRLDDYLMTAIDVDLELKFSAAVDVTYLHAGQVVATDVFSPTSGPDDGPDSKDGDNYRYFHRPMNGSDQVYFDEVTLAAISGAFSLEGGADLATNTEPNAFGQLDPTSKSSQFEIVPTFDGEITCGDVVVVDNEDVPGVVGEVTLHSVQTDDVWATDDCPPKPYNDGVTFDTISFVPDLSGTTARYTIVITLEEQEITGSAGQITSLFMLYDPEGNPDPGEPLEACEGQPHLDTEGDPNGYAEFWTQEDVGLLPAGETACYYAASVMPSGPGVGTEVWGIYFEDDPSFGFK
jgi:hypothetical protein